MLFNKKKIVHSVLIFLCSIGLLISVVPIVCFLIVIHIYRGCVWILLKRQFGPAFVGLLQRHDALWGVEEENSLSVIQSLILYENNAEQQRTSDDLRKVLEEKVRFWMTQPSLRKMFMKRKVKYGYNYLINVPIDDVQVDEYLRVVDIPSKEEFLCDEELKTWIGDLHSVPLPDDHSNFLEILVSKDRTKTPNGKLLFPVRHSENKF